MLPPDAPGGVLPTVQERAAELGQPQARAGRGQGVLDGVAHGMVHVAALRKKLGVRTIFNILGPLTNPAEAPNILMGVFHPDLVGIQVRVMEKLGAHHALVVYGRDGMDEVSLGAATMVGERIATRSVRPGSAMAYTFSPR